eukprot:Clim_evm26s232 gene=Clim_evmTU26s232
MRCLVCGSEQFINQEEIGYLICADCGTQSQDFRREEAEEDDLGGSQGFTRYRRREVKQKSLEKKQKKTASGLVFATSKTRRQWVAGLKCTSKPLQKLCKESTSDPEKLLRAGLLSVLCTQLAAVQQHIIRSQSSLAANGGSAADVSSRARSLWCRVVSRKSNGLNTASTLAIVYVAYVQCGYAVPLWELVQACRRSSVPYFSGFEYAPSWDRLPFGTKFALKPRTPLDAGLVNGEIVRLELETTAATRPLNSSVRGMISACGERLVNALRMHPVIVEQISDLLSSIERGLNSGQSIPTEGRLSTTWLTTDVLPAAAISLVQSLAYRGVDIYTEPPSEDDLRGLPPLHRWYLENRQVLDTQCKMEPKLLGLIADTAAGAEVDFLGEVFDQFSHNMTTKNRTMDRSAAYHQFLDSLREGDQVHSTPVVDPALQERLIVDILALRLHCEPAAIVNTAHMLKFVGSKQVNESLNV